MASVQLKLGDMFDGPSDLIVLPCSTSGTTRTFVQQRLSHHRIPHPGPGMKLGELSVLPFEGAENIAQYVGYAVSVEGFSSSEHAINRIGEQLGLVTFEVPTIRLISAPLLGAGAGGLASETVVGALSRGFKGRAHRDARLEIHVLHKEVFDWLSRPDAPWRVPAADDLRAGRTLRVFISYSRSSPEHELWVEQLGTYLRHNGVDARLDIWHLRRGMDLPQFMTNELALADRVILISDEKYAEKADGRVGGVGWETMIVQGDLAQLPPESTKYLVIVRGQHVEHSLPKYLKTKFVIHWPGQTVDERNKQTLLCELYDVVRIPPLGQKPVFL